MAAITGGVIMGVGSLTGAGINAWFNREAQEAGLKEHRRSEGINIRLAKKENVRLDKQFRQNIGLQKEGLAFEKTKFVDSKKQNQLNSMMNLFNNNTALSNQLVQNLRGRK